MFTIGADNIDDAPRGVELFYATMEALLTQQISAIGDMTLYPDLSEPDVIARLAPLATLINVHCRATNAMERFVTRMRADPLNRDRVDTLLSEVVELDARLVEPLDLDCACIVVDTTHGYRPSVDDVAAEILRVRGSP